MKRSEVQATFLSDAQTVWDQVVDMQDTAWRTDIVRTEPLNEKAFAEYPQKGSVTKFTIVKKEPGRLYELRLENRHFHGGFRAVWEPTESGGCKVTFTELIHLLNPGTDLLAHGWDLRRKQLIYVRDLKRKLGEVPPAPVKESGCILCRCAKRLRKKK